MSTISDLISYLVIHAFIFCGDFNLPGISWSNYDTVLIYSTKASLQIHCVPETIALNNFFQINNVFNYFGSLLDLIFVSHDQLSIHTLLFPSLLLFTHPKVVSPVISSTQSFFDFQRAVYASINNFYYRTTGLILFHSSTITVQRGPYS